MTMVATDGRRLALVDEQMDVAENSQGEFIVPSNTVNELNRLLLDKGEAEIRYAENQASFSLKDEKGSTVLIVTKLIEGNYPNYRQVIPAETKERVALVREEFLHALRRAEIMTSEKSNSVKLSLGRTDSRSPPTRPRWATPKKPWPSTPKARRWPLRSIPNTSSTPSTRSLTTRSSSS